VARESIEARRARLLPGAQWLRREREKREWSGSELARQLGIGQERVSAYERAQDEPPPEVASTLAQVFGMPEVDVWRHLGKPLPRELMSDEAAIAWVEARYPGLIDQSIREATGQQEPQPGPARPASRPSRKGDTKRGGTQTGPRRITRPDDEDRSARQA
jgi:transcriptional regulator with XRE-family HTH domain